MADRVTDLPRPPQPAPGSSVAPTPQAPDAPRVVRYGDKVYGAVTFLASLSIFVIMVWLFWQLASASGLSIHATGLSFLTGADWDETANDNVGTYHALPFIFGTLYSSFLALLLAVPVSIGAAIFLSEMAPPWIRTPATFLIELLAAIPSVVYGLWGIFIMAPWLAAHFLIPLSHSRAAHAPVLRALLSGQANTSGNSMLAAGVILAIMVTPFITAVTRDILRAIPRAQREGSYALGATQWETISRVVTPYAKSGIIGACVLGLGRALGETMAVTMVIGNGTPDLTQHPSGIDPSLVNPANTLASVLANKYNEAGPGLTGSALVEIGLTLLCVTIVVNIAARLLVFYTAKDVQGRK